MFTPGLVSVSIVTWNSAEHLDSCLESLQTQTYPGIEIVVVDNASADDSLKRVERLLPDARVVRNPTNLGYCEGHNIGIEKTSGEFFMPLNPDTVLSPTFIERLVDAAQRDPSIGTVTGKIHLTELDPESGLPVLDEAGLFLNRARRQFLRGFGEVDRGQYEKAEYVFGASGALPLYRRSMLQDIQIDGEYFDSSFFAHKEDVDLSWRAQLFGWKTYYAPSATAQHHRSFRPSQRQQMTADIRFHAVKNRYLLLAKNEHMINMLLHSPWIFAYDVLIIGYIMLFERSSAGSLLAAIKLLPQALQKRRAIQGKSRVDATYIRSFIR